MKTVALVLFIALFMLGCATSQSDVETDGRKQVFVVDQKVDDIYYRLTNSLEPGTTCEDLSVTRSFYYPERGEFSLSWGVNRPLGGGPFVIAVVKGKRVSGAQTEVTYLESRSTLPGVYNDVRNFVRGGHCT
jgi:hypothetical protein